MADGKKKQHKKILAPGSCDRPHPVCGFGRNDADPNWVKHMIIDTSGLIPVWVIFPGEEGEGRWKSETLFSSVIELREPSSWTSEHLSWEVPLLWFFCIGKALTPVLSAI
jgi:hypothetical protein